MVEKQELKEIMQVREKWNTMDSRAFIERRRWYCLGPSSSVVSKEVYLSNGDR